MRRNLLIAQNIKKQFDWTDVMVVAGAKEAAIFAEESQIECLTVPSFHKAHDGSYRPRHLSLTSGQLQLIRGEIILSAVKSYRPHVLIVDKLPGGLNGELLPALQWLAEQGNCRCVLGLREILDAPASVREEWKSNQTLSVVRRFFDSVWIYGDPRVFDAVEEYQVPSDIACRFHYTGYLNGRGRIAPASPNAQESGKSGHVLCTVGGGQDGEFVARHFVQAMKRLKQPSVLLCGPYMPRQAKDRLRHLSRSDPWLEVVDFVTEGDRLLDAASHVVCMGGYNSICSVLAYEKSATVIPRVQPRSEQLIRASRLAQLGFVSMITPSQLTPVALAESIAQCTPPKLPSNTLNFSGLSNICRWLDQHVYQLKRPSFQKT